MLLVFFRAIVATCERKDQGVIALKLSEIAQCTRVIGEFVIGENASGHDIRTHHLDPLPADFLILGAASFVRVNPAREIRFLDAYTLVDIGFM